jgi:hypothetical protein
MTLPYPIPYPYTQDGENRYQLHPPQMYDDGDHVVVFIKRDGRGWFLTDEGHTAMMYGCRPVRDTHLDAEGYFWATDVGDFVDRVLAAARAVR